MQEFINAFVAPAGMNTMLVYFLLVVPLIALFGTLARHLLGLKTMSLGVFLSLVFIMAFTVPDGSLYSIGIGITLVSFIYLFSYYIKRFTINAGMHYYGRISFVLSSISVIVVLVFLGLHQVTYIQEHFSYNMVNPFAVLLAVALGEQFSSHQIQKGIKTSRGIFLNTLILASLFGFTLSLRAVETFIFNYPYIVIFALLINYFIGKYQGMRLSEIMRFQSVASSIEKND